MDNAGGHGTDDAKILYSDILKKFNVEIIWQPPRSPKVNMLDLGVWMSIQSVVTQVHHMRRCHHDALAKSVFDAWNNNLSSKAFSSVHDRLQIVFSCIYDDKGGNHLVELNRGKLFQNCTLDEMQQEQKSVDDNSEPEDLEFENV